MAFYIEKSSGQKELFDIEKFARSLRKAGAGEDIINQLAHEIEERKQNMRTTSDVYAYARDRLAEIKRPLAARYNLKHALLQLGPSGYPFEKFIAQLFQEQGFEVEVGRVCKGFCIEHELDVVAQSDDARLLIECKFHNSFKLKSDVKIPLYVKARFDDLQKGFEVSGEPVGFTQGCVVTNTNFTTQAINYATCVGLDVLSWSYPQPDSLPHIIDKMGIHPITALTSISTKQQEFLIKKGFVLCRDVGKHINDLKQLNVKDARLQEIIDEAEGVCTIGK